MKVTHTQPRLEFVRIHQARLSNSYNWTEHVNDEIELTYVLRGEFHGFVDEQEYSAPNGYLYFVQPGQKHWEEAATNKLDYICLRFKLWDLDNKSIGFINNICDKPPCVYAGNRTIQLLSQMLKLSWINDIPENLFAPLIYKILEQIEEEYHSQATWQQKNISDYRKRIEPALNMIDNNLSKSYTVTELADVCYISSNHFSHIFKNAMGMPPLRYANKMRMDAAKKMLADKTVRVHEVAATLGFEDQFYFSRLFKKFTGLSPQDFRAYINHASLT